MRITVLLTTTEFEALRDIAASKRRDPRDQAAVFIVNAIRELSAGADASRSVHIKRNEDRYAATAAGRDYSKSDPVVAEVERWSPQSPPPCERRGQKPKRVRS